MYSMSTNIKADTHFFEIKYIENGLNYTTVISTGIISDAELVIKFLRKKYKKIELTQIREMNY